MIKSEFIKRIEDELILAAKEQVISSYTAETLEELCRVWDKHSMDIIVSTDSTDRILKLFTDLCNGKTLFPVDLETDEVINIGGDFFAYKRCKDIIKNNVTNTISYKSAYKIICKKFYNVIDKICSNCATIHNPDKIYLSKGGVITNEYIEKVYIRGSIFMPKNPVNLDCSKVMINLAYKDIYTIDSRSNKLKALMEFYEVPILKDDKFKNIDLRNFKFEDHGNNDCGN